MKKIVKVGAGLISFMPFLALAADNTVGSFTQNTLSSGGYLSNLLTSTSTFLGQIVVVLIAFAVVWFIWNVIKYTMSSDEEGKEKAKMQMIWGIVSIAVIISIWGLVGILQSTFGLTSTGVSKDTLQGIIPR